MTRHLAALLFCSVFSLPSQAFLSDSEARQHIKDLRAEMTQNIDTLRQRVEGLSKNQLDFANQIESLRADLSRLTGQVEVLVNSLDSAHRRQQDFYVDLDNRLRKLEIAAAAAVVAAAAPPVEPAVPKSNPQAEMRDYEAALGLFRENSYKEAQFAFEAFLANHPQSAMLPSAHYWLGSSLFQQKGFLGAAFIWGKVAALWPNDSKAPDAMLQQANALVSAKDVDSAIKVLEMLVERYPTHPAVETARARLKTLAPKKKR